MVKVKTGDFIELEYTGKLANGKIFDTNNQEEAKKLGFKGKLNPLVIYLGNHQIVTGLENDILGKELNKKYVVNIKPEDAYGKKDLKLVSC